MDTVNTVENSEGGNGLTRTDGTRRRFVYILAMCASLSGFAFGYDVGVLSGSILLLQVYFHLDTLWIQLVIGGTVGSSIIFAILGGKSSDLIGRRRTIMLSSVITLIGSVIVSASSSKEMLLLGRLVLGVANGLASVTIFIYVGELVPPQLRGTLQGCNLGLLAVGVLLASIIVGLFAHMKNTGWRYCFGLAAAPAAMQFMGLFFLPETPRWLIKHGYEEKAHAALVKICGTSGADTEMTLIKDSLVKSEGASHISGGSTLVKVLATSHVRRAFFVGCSLMFFNQMCGTVAVTHYSGIILRMAGFSITNSIWLIVLPNIVNLIGIFIGVYLIDRLGRKVLLLTSFVGLFIALTVLAAGFQLAAVIAPSVNVTESLDTNTTNAKCNSIYRTCDACTKDVTCGFCYDVPADGSCLPADPADTTRSLAGRCNTSDQSKSMYKFAYDYCPNNYGWMPVVGLIIFMLSFASGAGTVPWVVNSEIYPMWARGTCNAIAAAICWSFNLTLSLTFLSLTAAITTYGTFWLFAIMSVLGFIVVLAFLPETRNKTLEDMEQLFMCDKTHDLEKTHLLENHQPYACCKCPET